MGGLGCSILGFGSLWSGLVPGVRVSSFKVEGSRLQN